MSSAKRRSVWVAVAGALVGLVFAWPASAADLYEIEDLGTLGGPTAAAYAINNSGDVVGWSLNQNSVKWGFLLAGESRTNLSHWSNNTAEALGVNNWLEETCGWGLNENSDRRAVVWIFDLIADLGTFGGKESQCYDLNDSTRAVGWAQNDSGARRAFVWFNIQIHDLGTLGGPEAEAHAINNVGWIAGRSDISWAGINPPHHAAAWNGLTVLDLGTLGGANSGAEGMNDLCQVAGASQTGDSDPDFDHAFLWLPAPAYGLPVGMNDLGTLPETSQSIAWNINGSGEVVGASGSTDAGLAFIWDGTNGMRNLNNHIVTDEDWVLLSARGINAGGVIVGAGLHNGVARAYRLTPLP